VGCFDPAPAVRPIVNSQDVLGIRSGARMFYFHHLVAIAEMEH